MKKYIIGIMLTMTAVFAFIALLPLRASFSANKAVQQLSDGKEALIEVELPQANGERISSLQLRLAVVNEDGEPAEAGVLEKIEDLSFSPDEAVSSKTQIWEGRYHKDAGTLDIYIAGEEPLFSEEDKLKMGTVTAELLGMDQVYVKVEEESFQVVKGVSLETVTDEQNAVIRINDAAADPTEPVSPSETVIPTEPVNPSEPAASAEPTDPGESAVPTEPAEPGESMVPTEPVNSTEPVDPSTPQGGDTSKLRSALETAESYQESEYTAESFALLKKAVEEGRMILNNPNATQEELDRAADAIYNAIGTLVRVPGTSADRNNNYTASEKPSAGKNVNTAAMTKDTSPVWPYVTLLLVSVAVLAVAVGKRKNRNSSGDVTP